ncbi:UNVERIFIED_CONTAM: hypothetical protein FKN15_031673 [Acipenser sinensis]
MKTKWYCTLETPPPAPVLEECEEEGALYTVTRRQQQSQHSATRGQPWHGDGVGHSETCLVRSIKAGTVDRLVLHLLDCFRLGDSSYVSIFLSTYRTFSSPEQALRILLDRSVPKTRDGHDGVGHSETCLVRSIKAGTVDRLVLHLLDCFRLGDSSYVSVFLSTYRTFSSPEQALRILLDRLEFPPVGSAGSAERSARERLEFNNTVSSVFSTWLEGYPEDFHALGDPSLLERLVEVLRTRLPGSEVKGRAHMLLREECRARKNFSSLYAIISALQSNGVHRLKRTWEETSRDAVRSYEELSEIFSEADNYSHSRELLKEVVTPHPSPLTPPFTPHSSSLIPQPSHLTSNPSLLTPDPSPHLTPHASPSPLTTQV